jgi:hypothetical protein
MKTLRIAGLTLTAICAITTASFATPTGTVWTPVSPDFQSFGVLHAGMDNYFSVQKNPQAPASFPTDIGLTIGVLPFEKVQMEVGIDGLYPQDTNNAPFYFNGKLGLPEGALFALQPMIAVGIYNVGTKKDKTDYNIMYGILAKSFGPLRLTAGGYSGNSKLLLDSDGKKANTGFVAAADFGFYNVGGEKDGYNKFVIGADYMSGKSVLGGYGVALNYYFSKDASILVGPTFFNNKDLNGKWKLTVQFDGNINIFGG